MKPIPWNTPAIPLSERDIEQLLRPLNPEASRPASPSPQPRVLRFKGGKLLLSVPEWED